MTALKILKWTIVTILSLIVLWIIAGVILIFVVAPRTDIKPIVENALNKNLEAKSSLGGIDVTFFSSFPYLALSIDDFTIYDSQSSDTIVHVDNASLDISVISLMNNYLVFKNIDLEGPYVNFIVDSTGSNNLSHILKKGEKSQDTTLKQPELFNLNNSEIRNGRFDYSNETTDHKINLKNLNFNFQGRINTKDTVLDIRKGEFFVGENSLNFNGHIDPKYIDFNIDHNLNNLNTIKDVVIQMLPKANLKNTDFKGDFQGLCHIEGELNDSLHGITIFGQMSANNISGKSTKKKGFIKEGEFDLNYRFITGQKDSMTVTMNHFKLIGQYFSINLDGKLTCHKEIPYIVAHLNTEGDLGGIADNTSLVPEGHSLKGDLKADLRTSSSIYDLQHKYKYPQSLEDIYDLDINVVLPNINGTVNLSNINVKNDTLKVVAEKLNISVDGKSANLATNFHNLEFRRNGVVENASIEIKDADINIDGMALSASIKVNDADLAHIIAEKDTAFVTSKLIDLNLASKGKNIADLSVKNLFYKRGETSLSGEKIDGHLLKLSNTQGKIWDACSAEASSTKVRDGKLGLFCQKVSGSFNYDGNISGVKADADSINIEIDNSEFNVKGTSITEEGSEKYRLRAKSASAEKLTLGLDIDIKGVDALYDSKDNLLTLKTQKIIAGNTDISAHGTVNLAGKAPVVDLNLEGRYLDLNEFMIASNKAALAAGDPNAVPLDSIPEGQIPVTVGAPDQDITLALDINKMTLTSLLLSNATGTIYMKGRTTLIDNMKASADGYKLNMSTMITYINPRLSINDIILNFEELDLAKIGEIASIDDAAPLLSTLRGTVALDLVLRTPVRQILTINILESKATAALEARNLSVTDNETIQNIAKELMFKDKEHIRIDSIAIAAEIENGQVKLHPFMAKIDRYKLAMEGTNDMITKNVDYHISILKSPIPFKFGINIKGGGSGQKVKLVKTELKKLDPSIKPWTDPNFITYSNLLRKPIEDFRKSVQ